MQITAIQAVTERSRAKGNLDVCKRCRRSYNDVEEGWNCRRFDATIVLASGATLKWPGQACDRAYANDCQGAGFEKAPFAAFKSMSFPAQILCAVLVSMVFAALLVWGAR